MVVRLNKYIQTIDIAINEKLEPCYNSSDEDEKLQYFYHPDHLGSSSFITDAMGYAVQHLQYLPFGETFVDQQNGYDSRYTFSAKEKDDETQYSYFGARYYDSDLSVWLSVDPMSDKLPSITPYSYCLNNPILFMDNDGRIPWPTPFAVILKTGEKISRWIPANGGYFGWRTYNGASQFHPGLDINLGSGHQDRGVPVYATHNGTVMKVGGLDNAGGYRVTIRSEDGEIQTSYMHLNEKPSFKAGDKINEGQIIGHIGNSSSNTENASFGPHLHYELFMKNKKGQLTQVDPFVSGMLDPIDPQALLNSGENFNADNYSEVYLKLNPPVTSIDLNECTIVGTRETPQKMESIQAGEISL